jgi:hypothetical protein
VTFLLDEMFKKNLMGRLKAERLKSCVTWFQFWHRYHELPPWVILIGVFIVSISFAIGNRNRVNSQNFAYVQHKYVFYAYTVCGTMSICHQKLYDFKMKLEILQSNKVCGWHSVTFLHRTPLFDWCVIR